MDTIIIIWRKGKKEEITGKRKREEEETSPLPGTGTFLYI